MPRCSFTQPVLRVDHVVVVVPGKLARRPSDGLLDFPVPIASGQMT
jgi:hypothetical protein